MTKVYLIIRDEGDYSDREWTVEAVFSTLDKALGHACSLAASQFEKCADRSWKQIEIP